MIISYVVSYWQEISTRAVWKRKHSVLEHWDTVGEVDYMFGWEKAVYPFTMWKHWEEGNAVCRKILFNKLLQSVTGKHEMSPCAWQWMILSDFCIRSFSSFPSRVFAQEQVMRRSQLRTSGATVHTYFHPPEMRVFTSRNVLSCVWLELAFTSFFYPFPTYEAFSFVQVQL